MAKKRIRKKRKRSYVKRNWSKYNQQLKRRGALDLFITEDAMKKWLHNEQKVKGGNKLYSDLTIILCLQFRQLFKIGLRQTEGLIASILRLMQITLPIPDFSTLSRRTASLNVEIPQYKSSKNVTLLIDASGLKVYEAGEWAERKRGYNRHKMWRKLHIIIDGDTQEIIACDLTLNSVDDAEMTKDLLKAVKKPYKKLVGDTGYDKQKVYDPLDTMGITPVIKPQKNAVKSKRGSPSYEARNKAVECLQDENKKKMWKKETGYSRRSLVETAFYRYKVTFGDKLLARKLENQKVEAQLNCAILNKMLSVGEADNETIT